MNRKPPTPIRLDAQGVQLWQQVKTEAGTRKGSKALNEAMQLWLDLNKDKR